MAYQTKLRGPSPKFSSFNPSLPYVMHIDINSAFASIEQQANPLLRGVPTVVAARSADYGCILASSQEAKLWGVKTGMRVQEGKERCPFLVVRPADPPKYRHIHHAIKKLLASYSDVVIPKSIDEFVTTFFSSPSRSDLVGIARDIQHRISSQVGDWLTVSIGISTNRLLAKLGSDLKRDEPFIIDSANYLEVYQQLKLSDFCGISHQLIKRLNAQGIHTPLDFAHATPNQLFLAFHSRVSQDWYQHLHGYETNHQDKKPPQSFGQSYVLPHPMARYEWFPVMAKLTHKAGTRMRARGYSAQGVHLYLRYADRTSWHKGLSFTNPLFKNSDLLGALSSLIPTQLKPLKKIALTLHNLTPLKITQSELFTSSIHKRSLISAIDQVNARYGTYTLHSASMLGSTDHVHDAIAFGK